MNLRIPFISLGIVALQSLTTCTAFQVMTMSSTTPTPKSVLYDVPVSNNGARCRLILYKKKIPKTEVDIVSPMTLEGGLKGPAYLAKNPQGKMPLLSLTSEEESIMNIPESDTICRYLLSTYEEQSPSFLPNDTKSNLIARIHDMYLTTIQGCMYKPTPPFGIFQTRSDAFAEFTNQLSVINDLIDECDDSDDTHYLCGKEVSLADATLFPTMIFADKMLPKFGFENPLPDKILKWYNEVKAKDEDFAKVYDEVSSTCS
jgi:glutathione S-transferase